jgi:ABC-type nitrate/sulfonate/bicarbonate transport system substrate-binding protein
MVQPQKIFKHMNKLIIALDWTPNINHIGFFVAQEKGFYKDVNLEVTIVDPSMDNYQITPAKKVELGTADFALCPTESVISYRTKSTPFNLIGIACLLKIDLSAIVVLSESGINRPKDLDGKIYSSYKARYEDGIIKELIKNDGGNGNIEIIYPNKLGIWNTIVSGEADATWIFQNWEGVEAEESSHSFNYFHLRDYNIPYSYSPLIATNERSIADNQENYRAFLAATKRGYLYSRAFPKDSTDILSKFVPEYDQKVNLIKALEVSAPHFGNENTWGKMDEAVIQQFLDWIKEKQLETSDLRVSDIISNRCL